MVVHDAATDGDVARAIVRCAPETDPAAEAELYRRFAPRVRLYGLRHLRDDEAARDLAQQVLLLTISRLREGAIRDTDQVASFIFGASRTMTIDLKRQERRRERLRDTYLRPEPTTGATDDVRLDVDRLERCLRRLGERERLVVLLTFYGEKTTTDVGRELAVSEGNVRVIRHRAIQRLRACVTGGEAGSHARM
jgi:RNA polymerase sigma-70 factor (ECF subfamily)